MKIADLHTFIDWGSLSPALCEFLCKSLREGLDGQCMLYKYYDVKNVAGMNIDPDKYGLHLFPFRTYSEKWCLVAVNRSQHSFGMWLYIPDDSKCFDPFQTTVVALSYQFQIGKEDIHVEELLAAGEKK